jgi:hypothetical protein
VNSSPAFPHEVAVEIGGVPILLRTQDLPFRDMLTARYRDFLCPGSRPRFEFDVLLVVPDSAMESDEDVSVSMQDGRWSLRRGDFRAEWDPRSGHGIIRQSANPYSIDTVLRIVHTLILARDAGFLLHAASAVRGQKAFLFSGVSGAGKTTISSLAPADVTLLTDEISYIRQVSGQYRAFGTPFAGELARPGENCHAPISTLFFLEKGPSNRRIPMAKPEAVRRLMRNILFFAEDPALVDQVFRTACHFVESVSVEALVFVPDAGVWELIK